MTEILEADVLVRAFVAPGSAEETAFRRVLEGEVDLVTKPSLLFEFAKLLAGPFGWDPVVAEHAVAQVARVAVRVS